jgi:transposase
VDEAWLPAELARGRSIEAIARDARRNASRGIDRALLAEMTARGMSIRRIAGATGVSATTVRYWLREYGLPSAQAVRRRASAEAKAAGVRSLELRCARHGVTRHVRRRDGFRCARCEAARVADARRRMKLTLVAEAGGQCALCGYDRCVAALQFHQVDPATKSFHVSREGVTRSLAAARAEARKCVLLCANCHAEVEAGYSELRWQPPL